MKGVGWGVSYKGETKGRNFNWTMIGIKKRSEQAEKKRVTCKCTTFLKKLDKKLYASEAVRLSHIAKFSTHSLPHHAFSTNFSIEFFHFYCV